ncbi:MAG TPA: hypothetical protein VMR21_04245, partial [Vicinamibacteria bacterium]|nr:hypothetical protein [Vicinamibacteria bacterium]
MLVLATSAMSGPAALPEIPATGDYAALELYTRLAASGQQLLGPYSRFGFHHPGPAWFYASVPLYLLSGERLAGILLSAALLNAVAVTLILWRVGRDGGWPALLAASIVLGLFVSWRGPGWFFSAWNPNVVVMPFGVAVVWLASVAAGHWRALPVGVVAASFAAQTHVGCLPAALVVVASAAVLLLPAVRRWTGLPPVPPLARGPLLLSAALAGVLWAAPIVEQLRAGGGNLGHIAAFSARSGAEHAPGEVLGAAGAAAVGWMVGARGAGAAGLLLVVAVVLAGAHLLARRAGHGFAATLGLLTFAGLAAAVFSTARVTGPLLPYLLRWMAMFA